MGCSMLNVECWMFLLFAFWLHALPKVSAAETNSARTVIPAIPEGRLVDTNTMQNIFDEVKTPFKYGVVIKGAGTNELVDCPSIFRSGKH